MEKNIVLVKWNIEKIWENNSECKNHKGVLYSILPQISEHWSFDAIGHRVVHGGEYFKNSVIITDEVISKIEECVDLAPLHNPANLAVIAACKEIFPASKQIAVFDTAFHQTMEPAHYLYPLPSEYYETHKIRRYGFHGISHQYVYEKLLADYKAPHAKIITCHIGNWASVAAIKDGKVVETSMGMTPLEWLMMGTRSGNIDPAIVTYLMKHEVLSVDQIDELLNEQSWLLGVSWISNDMRDIISWIEQWNQKCSLALDMYINSLVKYIGAYVALLWGIDVLVLTAGIMEHRTIVRTRLLERLSWLWIVIDIQANEDTTSLEKMVSTKNSNVAVFVIPTNEELMIAKETFGLMNNE